MTELLNPFETSNNKELSLSSSYDSEQILYRSCLIGDLERVQYLLSCNSSSSSIDLNRQNIDGLTLLHFACSNNCYGLVQLLLEYHANRQVCDHLGRTCLHYASIKGHRAIVSLLLQSIDESTKQTFIQLCDGQQKNALDYASENDHLEVLELLLQHGDLMDIDLTSPLYYSSVEGHLDICHLLIRKQRERKMSFRLPSSFIQTICDRGQIEILRLLIDSIEDMSIHRQQRDVGNSVLFHCISTFHLDLVKQLLERQARLTEKDIHDLISFCPSNDENPLYIDHYFDCLEFLFRYRSNFDDQKICKYFLRQLCEKCNNATVGKKLKYLVALAIHNGSIALHRRSTMKWCGELNITCKRYVNLTDVVQQAAKNWSLKHLLRLKIKRTMKSFTVEQLRRLPGLQEHHVEFLSFEYL
jgi:ankyrin repeat protein